MRPFGHIEADSRICSALAGLEAGILGGLCLLLWQALGSLLAGEQAWDVSVGLLAAVFGRAAYRDGVLASAVAGIALQIFGGGSVGVLFGLLLRVQWAWRRVVMLGLVASLAWYYLAYEVLLRALAPGRYPPGLRLPLISSHLAFGLVLSAYPRFLSSLRQGLWSGR
jgi:hypothetical protein